MSALIDFAKIGRLLVLAQRKRLREPTVDNLIEVKRIEREYVELTKEILNIKELTDEP